MTEPKPITEEMGVHKEWYDIFDHLTIADLPEFFDHLLNDYKHDYGTCCHATAVGALATASVFNKVLGLTGFQVGCVGWSFIAKYLHKDGPLKLIDFEEFLYPQYADDYEKTMSKETFKWLQEEAKKKLGLRSDIQTEVEKHWQSIVDGVVPFGYTVKDD